MGKLHVSLLEQIPGKTVGRCALMCAIIRLNAFRIFSRKRFMAHLQTHILLFFVQNLQSYMFHMLRAIISEI